MKLRDYAGPISPESSHIITYVDVAQLTEIALARSARLLDEHVLTATDPGAKPRNRPQASRQQTTRMPNVAATVAHKTSQLGPHHHNERLSDE